MNVTTALNLLRRRSAANRAEVFPLRSCSTMPVDPWPIAALAAISLTGWLDDAADDGDLDEALDHFQSLFFGGVVSRQEWADEIVRVSSEGRQQKNDAPRLRQTRV